MPFVPSMGGFAGQVSSYRALRQTHGHLASPDRMDTASASGGHRQA